MLFSIFGAKQAADRLWWPSLTKDMQTERHLMLFSIFRAKQAANRLWWPSLTKDMQTEQLLCWSGIGMTNPNHITSGSNEEEAQVVI